MELENNLKNLINLRESEKEAFHALLMIVQQNQINIEEQRVDKNRLETELLATRDLLEHRLSPAKLLELRSIVTELEAEFAASRIVIDGAIKKAEEVVLLILYNDTSDLIIILFIGGTSRDYGKR